MTPFSNESANARNAQVRWSRLPIRERLRPLRTFRSLLVEAADSLGNAAHAEVQRSPDELVSTDLIPTAAAAKFLERRAASILVPRRVGDRPLWLWGCRDVVSRRPRGVVGLIGTWNYPVFLNAVPILHALAAGNAVLWKPSERVPRTAEILHDLLLSCGFPPDLLIRLPATREAGPALVEADIDHLHFTGSEPVGRAIARRLGERLIPSTLELSGCDAMFVLNDADIERAAKLAVYGSTLNNGRTCMAVRRVLVDRAAFGPFVARLREQVAAVENDSADPDEWAHRAKLLAEARARTCEVLEGNPTVIVNAKGLKDLAADREPLFAPLVTVAPFDTLDDALEFDAATEARLTASIVTANPVAARVLAERLHTPCVVVNDVIVPTAHPATPFGGRGAGGWGSTQGREGLLEMTVPQVVTVRTGSFLPHAERGTRGCELPRGYFRLVHGRGVRERWRGFRQLLAGLRRRFATSAANPASP